MLADLTEVTAFLHGVKGIILALVTLLTATFGPKVWDKVREPRRKAKLPTKEEEKMRQEKLRLIGVVVFRTVLVAIALVFLVAAFWPQPPAPPPPPPPTREELLKYAWDAYIREDWNKVRELTTKICSEFENIAK